MHCLHCNEAFSDNGTMFCRRQHRVAYNAVHALCNVPNKLSFWTAEDTWDYIDSCDELYRVNLRPYDDCTCGLFHFGHGEPNKYSRQLA